jgi:RNA polymerase sigma-70 factor (ECF subfamily)
MDRGDRVGQSAGNTAGAAAAGRAHFATTRWSLVLEAGQNADVNSREALAQLCRMYWYPLYAYVRRRGSSAAQAEDLTQGFFAQLLEQNIVKGADPARGRFRAYLLGALRHFLSNQRSRERTIKRGGGRKPIPLDVADAERRYGLEVAHELTPERIYERGWALTLLERVMGQLREQFEREGKGHIFDRLRGSLGGGKRGSSRQIAAELELSEGAVRVALHRLRGRYRALLREQIAQTVASADQIEAEIRHLFAVLGR